MYKLGFGFKYETQQLMHLLDFMDDISTMEPTRLYGHSSDVAVTMGRPQAALPPPRRSLMKFTPDKITCVLL